MVICRPSGCPHTRWLPPSWRYSDHPRFRRNASTSLSFAIETQRRPREELGLSVEEEEEGDRAQANIQGDFVSPGTAGGESFPLCRPCSFSPMPSNGVLVLRK